MAAPTRRSRRVAGLPPTTTPTTTPPPPQAASSGASQHGFRRTAARTPGSKKRLSSAVEGLDERDDGSPSKRRRVSTDATEETPSEQLARELAVAAIATPLPVVAVAEQATGNSSASAVFPSSAVVSPAAAVASPVAAVASPVAVSSSLLSSSVSSSASSSSSLLRPSDIFVALPALLSFRGRPDEIAHLHAVINTIAAWKAANPTRELPTTTAMAAFLDSPISQQPAEEPALSSTFRAPSPVSQQPAEEPAFCSTFRAPSPNNPADWSSDSDSEDEVTAPEVTAPEVPFSSTFRAPSPNNPADWSSSEDSDDEEPLAPAAPAPVTPVRAAIAAPAPVRVAPAPAFIQATPAPVQVAPPPAGPVAQAFSVKEDFESRCDAFEAAMIELADMADFDTPVKAFERVAHKADDIANKLQYEYMDEDIIMEDVFDEVETKQDSAAYGVEQLKRHPIHFIVMETIPESAFEDLY